MEYFMLTFVRNRQKSTRSPCVKMSRFLQFGSQYPVGAKNFFLLGGNVLPFLTNLSVL